MIKTGRGVAYYKAVLKDKDAYISYLEERHEQFRKKIGKYLFMNALILVILFIYLVLGL